MELAIKDLLLSFSSTSVPILLTPGSPLRLPILSPKLFDSYLSWLLMSDLREFGLLALDPLFNLNCWNWPKVLTLLLPSFVDDL